MGEVACGLAVEFYDFFYAECGKELRDDNTADGVDGVDGYGEVGVGDSFAVDEGQGEHGFDVSAVVGGIGAYGAEVVDGRECVFAFGGDAEHFFTFGVVEEFTARVEEFKGLWDAVRISPPSAPSAVTAISVVGVEASPMFTTSQPIA